MELKPTKYQIAKLIYKSIAKISTVEEEEILNNWLAFEENKALFNKIIDENNIKDKLSLYNEIDTDKIYLRLEEQLLKKKTNTSKIVYLRIFKYAALLVLFLGIGYIYQQTKTNSITISSEPELIIASENITLQLDNGSVEIINEDGSSQVVGPQGHVVGTQKGNQLVYNKASVKKELVYNTLTVPYGKRFQLVLSDGTLVHLNAGTSLKYPINFIEGKDRNVFLDGEAYFDVTEDKKHPFIVNANEINIRVLGTQFNITSYPEDKNINTVLVEGAVSIYKEDEIYNPKTASLLKPHFMAIWDKNNKNIEIQETAIESHLAWMDGSLILKEVAFKDILKKLERQYNISFVNNYKALENRYFTARFDTEDIFLVMESLKLSALFNYTFNENQIIINP